MKKTCKRRHYPLINTVNYAKEGACITDGPSLDRLQLRELASLDAMTHGRGELQEWCDMDAMVRLCRMAASKGIGPEALECCETAGRALKISQERHAQGGRMGLSGDGIQALREVLEYADLQRRSIGRAQFEGVIKAALREARA